MPAEPRGRPARSIWAQRWYQWWPPAAAFFAVLIGVPAVVLGAAYAIAGGDDLYSASDTQSCLADRDLRVSARDSDLGRDLVARSAPGGALRVWVPDRNDVIISFGESPQDAERTQRAYVRFSGATIPLQDLLVVDKNVVLLWRELPSAKSRRLVTGCLR